MPAAESMCCVAVGRPASDDIRPKKGRKVLPPMLRVAGSLGGHGEAKRLTPYFAKSSDGVDTAGSDGAGAHPPALLITMRNDEDDARRLGA